MEMYSMYELFSDGIVGPRNPQKSYQYPGLPNTSSFKRGAKSQKSRRFERASTLVVSARNSCDINNKFCTNLCSQKFFHGQKTISKSLDRKFTQNS